ncbi:hypothetical protein SAMN03159341_104122 [Paenibacillus sp. 1_12]|uniref:hypothetical protein n=1 Tax=Paenibacillus sp. 1_12 TaxID=1566278 RepID=UPI0008F33FDD|nr:hypothetical protein [Paenibacillus sp. 1_12]SFL22730.1 hypothetical protein SAMN03159341_104122 [Paenibacillus sp. 1_12]
MKNRKPWMAAILSTALLFSGALTLAPKAFADDDESSFIERVKAPLDRQQYITDRLNNLMNMAITFSDKDSMDIHDALLHGQTLAQATGLDNALLSSKLRASIDQDLSNTLQNYTVTNEQLDTLKSDLYNGIQVALSTPGYQSPVVKNSFSYDAIMDKYMKELESDAAVLSEEDYIDIRDRLLQGSSLANATHLDQQLLTNALLRPIVQEIDSAAQGNLLTTEEAADLKDRAKQSIASAVSTPYSINNTANGSKSDVDAFINKHLETIFNDTYLVVDTEDLDYEDLKNAYVQGGSLSQLTGSSADELAARIWILWVNDTDYIDSNWSAQERSLFQQQATTAIKKAVTAAGK